jgi:hypothetical protein
MEEDTEDMNKYLMEAALVFWEQAESPSAEDMERLFYGLVHRDFGKLEELFDSFHIEAPWIE